MGNCREKYNEIGYEVDISQIYTRCPVTPKNSNNSMKRTVALPDLENLL